ncbi:MAG: carbohydrate kinase [Bacteroidetes bacterium]|nr:carbohydrate kinase [Bacteroidota bacterium]
MRRVFCIGETVLDIVFQNNQPQSALPGGSMLNTAVSLGRAGIPVSFISDYGQDQAGNIIHDYLLKNGVSTEYISRYSHGKTALALAFLDQLKNAEYSFYKNYPDERLTISLPVPTAGDIVLFGSFYALTGSLRIKITGFVQNAKKNGAFIIYDPNFRPAHIGELDILRPWILENMSMANLVRASDEDFSNIFSASNAVQAFQYVRQTGCQSLVYTRNSLGVEVITAGHSQSYPVPQIMPISTIGAGDAFNAGIIYSMLKEENILSAFSLPWWDSIIGRGIQFSADVCQRSDNYISIEYGNRLK